MATNKNIGKYFTVEVKPTIAANLAHADAALTANDVVFDWTSFKLRGGTNKLIGVTVIAPPTNAGVSQDFPLDLLFATQTQGHSAGAGEGNDPESIGTISSAATNTRSGYFSDLIGATKVIAEDYTDTEPRSIGIAGSTEASEVRGILFEPYGSNEDSEGRHTYYIAATTPGTPSLQSGIDLTADLDAGQTATLTVAGATAVTLAQGDVRHA
jgi:hypothetical protein